MYTLKLRQHLRHHHCRILDGASTGRVIFQNGLLQVDMPAKVGRSVMVSTRFSGRGK